MDVIREVLLRSSLILLCAGSIAGVLIGAWLLLKPERIVFWNQYFSRWISANKIQEQLDRPRWTERFFYRHHRLVGGVLFLGTIFVLYVFLSGSNMRRIYAAITPGNWWLMNALMAALFVGSALAALAGIIVLAKPSLLREIEKSANRWISTEGMVKLFDGMRNSFDRQILRHRKIAGVFMIIGGLYILIVVGPFLWRGE
jgi:hypothetical protein